MQNTSLTLLQQLQQNEDSQSWNRLVAIYAPLLERWLGRYEMQASDSEDLVQEVLVAVAKDIPQFQHNGRTGAFRSWLRTMLVHRVRNFWRARGRRPQVRGDSNLERQLDELEDPASQLSAMWNREHDQHVARQLLTDAEQAFTAQTWNAFRRVTLGGESADQVAADLGMTLNAVFIAKSRVLRRLRQQAAGLVDTTADFRPKP